MEMEFSSFNIFFSLSLLSHMIPTSFYLFILDLKIILFFLSCFVMGSRKGLCSQVWKR